LSQELNFQPEFPPIFKLRKMLELSRFKHRVQKNEALSLLAIKDEM